MHLQKHYTVTGNSLIGIDLNRIENRITFEIKRGYYFELLTSETIKILESTKSKITKNENGENLPHLKITEVSRVLYTFVPNKSFGPILDVSPKNFIFLKTCNWEFSYIEVWFTDQNSKPLEIEGKRNITLVIN